MRVLREEVQDRVVGGSRKESSTMERDICHQNWKGSGRLHDRYPWLRIFGRTPRPVLFVNLPTDQYFVVLTFDSILLGPGTRVFYRSIFFLPLWTDTQDGCN